MTEMRSCVGFIILTMSLFVQEQSEFLVDLPSLLGAGEHAAQVYLRSLATENAGDVTHRDIGHTSWK